MSSSLPLGTEINHIKKNFLESRSRRTTKLDSLSAELQGVQRVMFDNIDAVIHRGELVSGRFTQLTSVSNINELLLLAGEFERSLIVALSLVY